jgi:hypothetical protein
MLQKTNYNQKDKEINQWTRKKAKASIEYLNSWSQSPIVKQLTVIW